jgi:hypothetical protein
MSNETRTQKHKPMVAPDEKRMDQAIEDTFPASDPPGTTGGITRIGPREAGSKTGDAGKHRAARAPGSARHHKR